jgi:hypothetical protein
MPSSAVLRALDTSLRSSAEEIDSLTIPCAAEHPDWARLSGADR